MAAAKEIQHTVESGESFTSRRVRVRVKPRAYTSSKVRNTRSKLRLSQHLFADFLGTNVKTIESWEQGRRNPSPMARRFMDELNRHPDHWRKVLAEELTAK